MDIKEINIGFTENDRVLSYTFWREFDVLIPYSFSIQIMSYTYEILYTTLASEYVPISRQYFGQ